MAVTNYFTVDGEIIGESTNGVQLDYLTDAVGSVTATVDQTGTVQNTYRYKPYGALLAKTGTAPDPRFMWVGSRGYLQTGAVSNEVYVRARHYDSSTAIWTTPDKYGWFAEQTYNHYAANNPGTRIDPSGYLSIHITSPGTAVGNPACGAAQFKIEWTGIPPHANGWVIQHILWLAKVYVCQTGCCGIDPKIPPANPSVQYWEAWQVIDGQIYEGRKGNKSPDAPLPNDPGDASDYFSTKSEGNSTCGSIAITGKAKFIPNPSYAAHWGYTGGYANGLPTWPCPVPPAPCQPPPGWSDTGAEEHDMTVSWNCCDRNPSNYPRRQSLLFLPVNGILTQCIASPPLKNDTSIIV